MEQHNFKERHDSLQQFDNTSNLGGSEHCDNQQPGCSWQVDSDTISINVEKNLMHEKLEEFIKVFVKTFEEKLEQYKNDAAVEGISKTGKIGKKLGTLPGALPGAGLGLASAIPGAAGVGATLGGKASSSLINYSSRKDHRQKAKKVIKAFRNIKKYELRKILVKAGYDIFQSFESQFIMVTDEHGSWARAMEKLAVDAINRAINFIKEEKELSDISSDFITKGVIIGKSKESLGSTFVPSQMQKVSKLPKPGFTVYSKKDKWKTSELYGNLGLVTINEERIADGYYRKKDNSKNKFGYRLLFEWELSLQEKLSKEYCREENCPSENYQYILKSEEPKELLKGILDEINKQDPVLKWERIEEGVEKGNEKINQAQMILEINQQSSEKVEKILDVVKQVTEKTGKGVLEMKQEFRKIKQIVLDNQQIKDKKPVWFNMKAPVESFTGRDATLGKNELGHLHDALQSKSRQVVVSQTVSISGLGGIGKSELARKYAHDHRKDYASNVIWINSETQESLMESFQGLARELRISTTKKIDKDMKEQKIDIIKDVYKYFSDNDVDSLFIFDNAESYIDIKKNLPSSLFPDNKKPHILITSRNKNWEVGEEGKITVISLEEFTPEAALEFIKNVLDIEEEEEEEIKAIKQLAIELQNFPLALRQAVSYIKIQSDNSKKRGGEEYGISDYLIEYKHQGEKLLNEDHYGASDRYTKTVFTTWNTTLEKIEKDQMNGKQAIDILNVMAYFAPDEINIKEIFVKPEVDEEKLWNAVEMLDQYSMINLEKGVSSIHRLVQEVIRLKNNDKEEQVLIEALKLIKNCGTEKNSKNHVISIWNYASIHAKLINDFYSIYGYIEVTPLHLLAANGYQQAVDNILNHINKEQFSKVIDSNDKCNRTPLYMAAKNGYLAVVECLVAKGAIINTKRIDYASLKAGWTPLHTAALNGHQAVVEFLVKRCKELAVIEDNNKRTPAYFAVLAGHVDIVKFLKPKDNIYLFFAELCGARIIGKIDNLRNFIQTLKDKCELENVINSKFQGWSPLQMATFTGQSNVVEILIDNGSEVKDTNKNTITPLHFASSNGHLNVVEILIKHGADPNEVDDDGWTSLHAAAKKGHLEIVEYFLNGNYIDVDVSDKEGTTSLHSASSYGHLNVVEILIKHGADPNKVDGDGWTSLHAAAQGHQEIVEYFLNGNYIDVNVSDKEGTTPLYIASFNGHLNVVEILIKHGADPNAVKHNDWTSLHAAAQEGHQEIVEYFLNGNYIDVNVSYEEGTTSLHSASSNGHLNVVEILIKHGADPNKVDIDGWTSMHAAAQEGHQEIVEYFLNGNYIDVNVSDKEGTTSLHSASSYGHLNVVEILIKHGADPNKVDGDGRTSLHAAAQEGHQEIVEYFLNSNYIDVNVSDKEGTTPLHSASS